MTNVGTAEGVPVAQGGQFFRRLVLVVGYFAAAALVMWTLGGRAQVPATIVQLEVAASADAAWSIIGTTSITSITHGLGWDCLFIVAYALLLVVGARAFGRAYRVRRFRLFRGGPALALVIVAATLDLIEDGSILLGLHRVGGDLPWQIAACAAWAKFAALLVVVGYVVVAAFTYVVTPDWLREAMMQREEGTGDDAAPSDGDGTSQTGQDAEKGAGERARPRYGLAASGGGIRSASLVLGSLQALDQAYSGPNDPGPSWSTATKVTSVSGGSYISGGFSIARSARRDPPVAKEPSDDAWRIEGPPVADGPEERHLLTRLGYLLAPNPTGQVDRTPAKRKMRKRGKKQQNSQAVGEDESDQPAGVDSKDVPGLIALVACGAALNLAVLLAMLWLVVQPLGWLLHGDLLECPVQATGPQRWGQALDCLTRPQLVLPVQVWAAITVVALLVWVGAGWARAAFKPGNRPFEIAQAINGHGRSAVFGLVALVLLLTVVLLVAPVLVAVLPGAVGDQVQSLTPAAVLAGIGAVASLVRGLRGRAVRFAPYVGGALFVVLLTLVAVQMLANVSKFELTVLVRWLLWLALGAVAYSVVSAEWWSMAGFYRARLRLAFATYREQKHGKDVAEAYQNGSFPPATAEPSIHELQPRTPEHPNGTPLTVCATAHAQGPSVRTHYGVPAVSLTFSPDVVQLNLPKGDNGESTKVTATAHQIESLLYRRGGARLTTMLAVGVSGAAISPAMGQYRIGPTRGLIAAANVRLGIWMPNPRYAHKMARALGRPEQPYTKVPYPRPRLSYLLKEMFGVHDLDDPYLYVTDGGHWENTGLVELLRDSELDEIVCLDADDKPRQTVSQIAQAINFAALECGVQIRLSLDPLRGPAEGGRGGDYSPQSVALGLVEKKGTVGLLWYAKPVLTAGTPLQLLSYAECDEEYPATSTVDQFFHTAQFKAYRDLGRFNGRQIVIARHALAAAMHQRSWPDFVKLSNSEDAHWVVKSAARLLNAGSYPQIQQILGDPEKLRASAEQAANWPS